MLPTIEGVRPELQRFCDVLRAQLGVARQIRNGSRDSQDPNVSTGAQPESLAGLLEETEA
jgi:hypothetical protein